MPVLAVEGIPIAQALLEALAAWERVITAYQQYGERCRHLTGAPLLHVNYTAVALPHFLRLAQEDIARLEQLSAQA
jgi:hypothetical protein